MNDVSYQLELLAYNEKIHLAKLEAVKAQERVAELEYELSRYQMEMLRLAARAKEVAQSAEV
jgi:hypothetical protein